MILYIDASGGLSGDRALEAMRDLGLPGRVYRQALHRLGRGARALSVPAEAGRLLAWVEDSLLDRPIRQRAMQALKVLIRAEARVHGLPLSRVHFHQLARPDTLEAFVGFAAGLVHFRIEAVHVSTIRAGNVHRDPQGGIRHRPGPATLELLRGFPVRWVEDAVEWTTPTGAALLAAFASPDAPPPFCIRAIGEGTGSWPASVAPVRFLLGESWLRTPTRRGRRRVGDRRPVEAKCMSRV